MQKNGLTFSFRWIKNKDGCSGQLFFNVVDGRVGVIIITVTSEGGNI